MIRSYDELQRVLLPENAADRDVLKDRFRQALREAREAYVAVGNQLREMDEEGLDPWEECRANEGADAADNQPEVMSLQEKADLLNELIKEPIIDTKLQHNIKVLGTQVEILDPEKFLAISDNKDSFTVRKTDLVESPPCVFCKKTCHSITRCFSFSELKVGKRRSYVLERKLCWLCMKDGHMYRDCPVKEKIKQCNIRGCAKKQPAALFHSLPPTVTQSPQQSADVATPPPLRLLATSLRQVCTHKVNISALCSKTLLCDLFLDTCPGRKLCAYVILDEQANGTVLDERALNYFNISFATTTYRLRPADSSNTQTKNWTESHWIVCRRCHCKEIYSIARCHLNTESH